MMSTQYFAQSFIFTLAPFIYFCVYISLLELSDNLLPSHASVSIGVKNNSFFKVVFCFDNTFGQICVGEEK